MEILCKFTDISIEELLNNNLRIFLVFLRDGCVSVTLRSTEYAAVPLPCPPVKILRNISQIII